MLNEEKVKLMTKLAIYESNAGKKEIPMSRYFRSDYVSYGVVKTLIASTVAYVLIIALCLVYDLEGFMDKLVQMDILELGRRLLIVYVAYMIISILVAVLVYRYKFKKIRESLKTYNAGLKEINRMQEVEGKIREKIEMGGSDQYDESFSI
jgi:predicted PurR-regulated permease PerM